jgi:hypothetical protein
MLYRPTRISNGEVITVPDERQDSTRKGVAPAPESQIGTEQEKRQQAELIHTPPEAQPEGAIGGTSDSDSPADEAWTPKP